MSRKLFTLAAGVSAALCIALIPQVPLVWPPCAWGGQAPAPEGGREVGVIRGSGAESVEFSSDGRLLLTTGRDFARVWDARTFEAVTPPLPYEGGPPGHVRVGSAGFSPDGRRVITTTGLAAIVFDVRTVQQLFALTHPETPPAAARLEYPKGVWAAAYSPDGKLIATGGGDHTARLWDAADGKPRAVLRQKWTPSGIGFVAFSPDGGRLLTCDGGSTHIWDLSTRKELFEPLPAFSRGSPFSPDGKRLVTCAADIASVNDVATGEHLFEDAAERDQPVRCVAFGRDGTQLVFVANGEARVWDLSADPPRSHTLADPRATSDVTYATFSRDGRRVLTCSTAGGSGEDSLSTAVWDVETGKVICRITGCEIAVAGAFSPDGTRVAVLRTHRRSEIGQVVVWELQPATH